MIGLVLILHEHLTEKYVHANANSGAIALTDVAKDGKRVSDTLILGVIILASSLTTTLTVRGNRSEAANVFGALAIF